MAGAGAGAAGDPPAWLRERFPGRAAWSSLRACGLRVDAEKGAGLVDMEASELGYLVGEVADAPGQDPALRSGDAIVAIAGEPLLGLPEEEVEEVFGRHFRDGVEVTLLGAEELREALVERDSNEECPCEEEEDGSPVANPQDLGNYELLRRAKSSTEYDAVVKIPVGRATVWSLGPESMEMLQRDLAHLGGRFGISAEAKLNRDGNMESVVLSGLSSAIAEARPEAVQILKFYREGQWAAGPNPGADQAARPEDGAPSGSGGGGGAAASAGRPEVPEGLRDLRQFQYHDHTADIIVHSWGKTRAEAFAQVVVGMFQYMTDLDHIDLLNAVEVEATGHDLLDLLYHLLDEFLFVFGTEMHISRCVEIVEFDEAKLRIRARGYGEKMNLKKHEQGTEIKAITMHMMKILGPGVMLTEGGTQPREAAAEEDSHERDGFPHEVYVLLDI